MSSKRTHIVISVDLALQVGALDVGLRGLGDDHRGSVAGPVVAGVGTSV
jgi:hypothetical protein